MIHITNAPGGLLVSRWSGTDATPLEQLYVATQDLSAFIADLLAQAAELPGVSGDLPQFGGFPSEWDAEAGELAAWAADPDLAALAADWDARVVAMVAAVSP